MAFGPSGGLQAPINGTVTPDGMASAELRKWRQLPCTDISTLDFWSKLENQMEFPCLFIVFQSMGYIPHSNAECERDFSVLARLLTSLRKGKLASEVVERRMKLMLNTNFWNPLPERWGDMLINKYLEECKLTLKAADEESSSEDDNDDDDDGDDVITTFEL